jgi:hypothetical protein
MLQNNITRKQRATIYLSQTQNKIGLIEDLFKNWNLLLKWNSKKQSQYVQREKLVTRRVQWLVPVGKKVINFLAHGIREIS